MNIVVHLVSSALQLVISVTQPLYLATRTDPEIFDFWICMRIRRQSAIVAKFLKKSVFSGTHQQWWIVADDKKRTVLCKLEANVPAKRRINKGEKVDKKLNLNLNKDHKKAKPELPRKSLHQNPKLHYREKIVAIDQGVEIITLLPSLSPSLPSPASLPPATTSAFQSLALLTPRLLQGTMSLQEVGRETGLQEEVVRAWRDSIRICLPDSGGTIQHENMEI